MSTDTVIRIGTGAFLRRTGLSAPIMRKLEGAGIISPAKSDTGWRMFSEADVRAVAAHQAAKKAAKKARRK